MANLKTELFGNPNTLRLKHYANGFGQLIAGATVEQIFDLLDASYNRGGDAFLARADNDVHPRAGGFADALLVTKLECYNMAAFNDFTKGDIVQECSWMYEGRSNAAGKVLRMVMNEGMVHDDISISARHGATPGTASFSLCATLPLDADGVGAGAGPYSNPLSITIMNDNTRDDSWTPIAL